MKPGPENQARPAPAAGLKRHLGFRQPEQPVNCALATGVTERRDCLANAISFKILSFLMVSSGTGPGPDRRQFHTRPVTFFRRGIGIKFPGHLGDSNDFFFTDAVVKKNQVP